MLRNSENSGVAGLRVQQPQKNEKEREVDSDLFPDWESTWRVDGRNGIVPTRPVDFESFIRDQLSRMRKRGSVPQA